jgi:hypothetical protein
MAGGNPLKAPVRRTREIVGASGRNFGMVHVGNHPIASALTVVAAHILPKLAFMADYPKCHFWVDSILDGFLEYVVGYGGRGICLYASI